MQVFNLPNIITFFRLALAPIAILIMVYYPHSYWVTGIILLIAGISDILDGHLARSRDEVSTLGTMLDPVADKVLMTGILVVLALRDEVKPAVVSVLIIKELALLFGGLLLWKRAKKAIPASVLGKGATLFLYIGVLSYLFGFYALSWFIYAGVILSVIAGLHYLYLVITG